MSDNFFNDQSELEVLTEEAFGAMSIPNPSVSSDYVDFSIQQQPSETGAATGASKDTIGQIIASFLTLPPADQKRTINALKAFTKEFGGAEEDSNEVTQQGPPDQGQKYKPHPKKVVGQEEEEGRVKSKKCCKPAKGKEGKAPSKKPFEKGKKEAPAKGKKEAPFKKGEEKKPCKGKSCEKGEEKDGEKKKKSEKGGGLPTQNIPMGGKKTVSESKFDIAMRLIKG